jgi:hypothetical protein
MMIIKMQARNINIIIPIIMNTKLNMLCQNIKDQDKLMRQKVQSNHLIPFVINK